MSSGSTAAESVPSHPSVLFSVLHSGREPCLLRTLDAVFKQRGARLSVLLVDAGGEPGLETRLRERFPDLVYKMKPSNTGIASGRNFAMDWYRDRGFDYIFLLDNDIELEPGCLERLLAVLDREPDAGMAVPLILNEDGTVLSTGGRYLRLLGQPILTRNAGGKPRDLDFATGAIGLFRGETLIGTGPFDTAFDPYGFEDIDYGLRINDRGSKIRFVPDAVCRHISVYTFHKETEFHLFNNTNHRLVCAGKHLGGGVFIFIFFPWFFLRRVAFPVLKLILKGEPRLAGAVLGGLGKGLRAARGRR